LDGGRCYSGRFAIGVAAGVPLSARRRFSAREWA
jgi:hypothetical protein